MMSDLFGSENWEKSILAWEENWQCSKQFIGALLHWNIKCFKGREVEEKISVFLRRISRRVKKKTFLG